MIGATEIGLTILLKIKVIMLLDAIVEGWEGKLDSVIRLRLAVWVKDWRLTELIWQLAN